jgi:hypothetical protein
MTTNVNKQDSNVSGLRIAEETSFGVLPASPTWYELEPNEYKDFGAKYKYAKREPINDRRSVKKGVIVDKDAGAGLTFDVTPNFFDHLEALFFARWHNKESDAFGVRLFSKTFTVNAGTDVVTTATHGLTTGDGPFNVSSTTTLPAGLVAGTDYWVNVINATTFKLFASYANAIANTSPIDITDTGTGVHTMASAGRAKASDNSFHVNDPTGFAANVLVYSEGWASSANNGFATVSSVTGNAVIVSGLTLVNETAPSTAVLRVVGVKGTAGDLDVDASGDYATITSTTLDFTTLSLLPGEFIFVGGDSASLGFATATNNGYKRVKSIAAHALVLDKSASAMSTEASTTETVQLFFGRQLRNEVGTSIVSVTKQLERTLGAPDTTSPSQIQSEYVTGVIFDQGALSVPAADLVRMSLTTKAGATERRTGATGVKSGSRPALISQDAYNTADHISVWKLAPTSTSSEAPTALFKYLSDTTVTVSNNAEMAKGLGVLGAFDYSVGDFDVTVEATGYFLDTTVLDTIENNTDLTFTGVVAAFNRGFAVDIPVCALSDGNPDVKKDKPIMMPVKIQASEGIRYDSNFSHTLSLVQFYYLPSAAMSVTVV